MSEKKIKNSEQEENLLEKIKVLYEDEHIVVIDKPAGLIVHPDGRTEEPSVTDWVLKKYSSKYPDIESVGEPLKISEKIIYRPGIVHRLDRETSGALIIAKTQEAFESLKKQFQDRETAKTYDAFVYGEVELLEGREEGVIDRVIGKSAKDFRMWSAQRGARGELRDAVTEYKVLEKTEGRHQDGFSYLEIFPKTGRTHQIRVHLKAINHPVVADTLYAPKRKPALGFKRLALHARVLEFTNLEEKKVIIEAPLPEDFKRGLEKMRGMKSS